MPSQAIKRTPVVGAAAAVAPFAAPVGAASAAAQAAVMGLAMLLLLVLLLVVLLLLLLTCVGKSSPRHDEAAATDPPDTPPIGVTPGVTTPTFCRVYSTPKYLPLHMRTGQTSSICSM
jgi:hypothetical protein